MKILALNCGSSSVKYQLFDWEIKKVLAKGIVERIGLVGTNITHYTTNQKHRLEFDCKDHTDAILLILKFLCDEEFGVIKALGDLRAVGHRIVHGGEYFHSSVLIDEKVMERIEELSDLAPLHNPPNLEGITAVKKLMPALPQVAIFDTAFHQTMPDYAYMYAIPRKWYERYSIRRYGFHGTSHLYVSRRAAVMLGKPWNECNFISLHIGNGVSVTAIKNGRSIDTSMGYTPLEGAIMGTRCGDIDPSIPLFMEQAGGFSPDETSNILNRRSGILGITGKYTDRRDVQRVAGEGDKFCRLALDMEYYRLKKYIGSYYAVLGQVDAVIFTAGVGENSVEAREKTVEGLENLGIIIDKTVNAKVNAASGETDISGANSKVKVFMIPTDEERVFIEDVVGILNGTYVDCLSFKYTFSN